MYGEGKIMEKNIDEAMIKELVAYLRTLPMNTLFAQSVLLGSGKGSYCVDILDSPSWLYIRLDYSMSLFCSLKHTLTESEIARGIEFLHHIKVNREGVELLQLYPSHLSKYVLDKFPHAVDHGRFNFTFSLETFSALYKRHYKEVDYQELCLMNLLKTLTLQEVFEFDGVVVPKYFWTEKKFQELGSASGIFLERKLSSVAFSAMRVDNDVEVGIETLENARGRNFAFYVCLHYIHTLLESGLNPVWSCKATNTASRKLGEKLGFTLSRVLPYIEF